MRWTPEKNGSYKAKQTPCITVFYVIEKKPNYIFSKKIVLQVCIGHSTAIHIAAESHLIDHSTLNCINKIRYKICFYSLLVTHKPVIQYQLSPIFVSLFFFFKLSTSTAKLQVTGLIVKWIVLTCNGHPPALIRAVLWPEFSWFKFWPGKYFLYVIEIVFSPDNN